MSKGANVRLSGLCSLLFFAAFAFGQSEPTTNVLTRMTVIESEYGTGTAFSIDVDNREYWITAKHILTGAKRPPYGKVSKDSVSVRLLDPGLRELRWLPETFRVIDSGEDIDIVVLAGPNPLLQSAPAVMGSNTFTSVTLGGECEFLGYPSASGGIWAAQGEDGSFRWMPFVKHCYVSSLPDRKTKAVVLDGVNNPGFSGGPVIYRTGPDQKIIAVISGIVTEPAEVLPSIIAKVSPTHAEGHKEKVDLNSGFIVAYSIDPAIDAIRKNPIGPLRTAGATK